MPTPTDSQPAIMVAEGTNPGYRWRQYFVITDGRCVIVEMLPAMMAGSWKFHRVWVNPGGDWDGLTRDQIVAWKRVYNAPIAMAPDLGDFKSKLLAVAESGQIPERS